MEAQAGGITAATVEGVLTYQDFLSYGSELRAHIVAGYSTQLDAEYYHPLNFINAASRSGEHTVFVSPDFSFVRIRIRSSTRRRGMGGIAWRIVCCRRFRPAATWVSQTSGRSSCEPAFEFIHASWTTEIGNDNAPNLDGHAVRAHLTFNRDTQDRALVAQFGARYKVEAAYLFEAGSLASATTASPNTPSVTGQFSLARRLNLMHPTEKVSRTRRTDTRF